MGIGYFIESNKIIDEPTSEMFSRINYRYLIIDFIIAILCGISLIFAITKKSIIAVIGLLIIVTIKPALANAGLCYGIAANKYINANSHSNSQLQTQEYKKYIEYGNNSLKLFATNIIGLIIGLLFSLYILCD
jgi:Na+/H+ antiporter NhaC